MKTTCIVALLAAAGIASAGSTFSADLSGRQSWDLEGSPNNETFSVVVGGSDTTVTAVAWDTIFSSFGASWGSEATIGMDFDGDGLNDLFITPSDTSAPVMNEAQSSGGFINLLDAIGSNLIAVGGTIDIELFETFDDVSGAADGIWEQGSSVSFQVPAPGAAALLGMGGLVASRRRR